MKSLAVCVIGATDPVSRDVSFVVDKLLTPPGVRAVSASSAARATAARSTAACLDSDQVFASLLRQAQRYLARRPRTHELRVFCFDSLAAFHAAAAEAGHPLRDGSISLELLFVDVSSLDGADAAPHWAADLKQRLMQACEAHAVPARFSPHSFTFYLADDDPRRRFMHGHGAVHPRLRGNDAAARRADMLRIVLDHLDHAHFNRMLARSVDAAFRPVALAGAIDGFMRGQWGERWDFHAFTGSVVAAFIDSMHALDTGSNVRQLTGVNEHALACGALAGWQLFGRAYVIAITSGMIDEFKGTLSNLSRARAPGLIVCADSPSSGWFAFQGTINQDGDGREVVRARGLPHVYIESVDDIAASLGQAFDALLRTGGPVVVFATPAVLESCAALPVAAALPAAPRDPEADGSGFDDALQLVNHKDGHLLWQCGRLDGDERALAVALSRRAGIALADSLAHPGSVCGWHQGRAVETYLGTLGLYAFSRRVHRFLHDGDELNPPQQQSLFFLKSKADQLCTPFSEGRLARHLHVVQVNRHARDFAPFADVRVHMTARRFLERMLAQAEVAPALLEKRRRKIAALQALSPTLPVDWIETVPMTANYFFHRLSALVQRLIEQEGYRYVGVFDVGRCGVSAVRNMPRTDPGFSGWYGRALMGDALMALPCIALNAPHHVLAFVGDGARAIVPDIEAQLVAMQSQSPHARRQNVTVFYLANGVLSIIQSYLDFRFARHGGAQVTVPSRAPREGVDSHGALAIHRRVIERFDEGWLHGALSEPGRINFLDVHLAHNSSGDGMSLASESTWSRATPLEESLP